MLPKDINVRTPEREKERDLFHVSWILDIILAAGWVLPSAHKSLELATNAQVQNKESTLTV